MSNGGTGTRTIGVLTSGGDCAGLNAVIRAVTRRAAGTYGWRVLGIHDGFHGLMARPVDYEELSDRVFSGNLLRQGGTMLGTVSKGDPFAFPLDGGGVADRSADVMAGYRELGLDGLIVIGGDGSLRLAQRLAEAGGWNMVAVPKTIDNDVPLTEYAVGFLTAVSTAVEALDRLQPTAASHDRVMILEVMGRDAGHIALSAGIGGGADVILLPEIPYSLDSVAERIHTVRRRGRAHSLVVCAEAARPADGGAVPAEGIGHLLERDIARTTGAETRVTVLGHVQRGGIPSSHDRILASAFGVRAVDALAEGKAGYMVAWQHRQAAIVPLSEVVSRTRPVDLGDTLVGTARGLGICLGEP